MKSPFDGKMVILSNDRAKGDLSVRFLPRQLVEQELAVFQYEEK